MHPRTLLATSVATALALAAAPAGAVMMSYTATLSELNGSGASGSVDLTLDTDANTLTAEVMAFGVEAGQPHALHIHGFMDGTDAVTPPPTADDDGDGFVELGEGADFYGPIIVPLTMDGGMFSTAPGGTIMYTEVYDLTDPATFLNGFDMDDLMDLSLREIVLHGLTVDAGVGTGTDGEVDGTGGYLAVLPIAAGELTSVPEPGLLGMAAMLGLGAGVTLYRRRRKP